MNCGDRYNRLIGVADAHETEFELARQEHLAKYLILFAMQDGKAITAHEVIKKVKLAAEAIGQPFTTAAAHTAHDDLVGDRILISQGAEYILSRDEERLEQFDIVS